jgi:lipopolysaccharide transport system ATP-binding protein
MSDTVIKIENLSKQYRLGLVGSKTVSEDLGRLWAKVTGKEDPTLKVGVVNKLGTAEGKYIWALNDINFDVLRGEVLGIIGKNGAGKSTLLKILSKVTAPTTGSVKIKGRIASLLEVGTGFHPELTGRENIFLNGAILGMTKSEIRSKFDEIVDFSGVEKYIDTPVKRYSSGMYVRLAFAVAAHLEPEILVVDEVLAVGDAEFQKKALGKMQEVSSGQGRTLLFVSHNLDAVKRICNKCILLQEGIMANSGDVSTVVDQYLAEEKTDYCNYFHKMTESEKENSVIALTGIETIDEDERSVSEFYIDRTFGIRIYFRLKEALSPLVNIDILSLDGKYIASSITTQAADKGCGNYVATVWVPGDLLNNINYIIGVGFFSVHSLDGDLYLNNTVHYYNNRLLQFRVNDSDISPTRKYFKGIYGPMVRPVFEWDIRFPK